MKAQVKTVEEDLKQFKDIYKKYTDQLVKVKVIFSDIVLHELVRPNDRCQTWPTLTWKSMPKHWIGGPLR